SYAKLLSVSVIDFFERTTQAMAVQADAGRAVAMRAYLRDQFPFLGLPSPVRKTVVREQVSLYGRPSAADGAELARLCFSDGQPREVQYLFGDLFIPQAHQLPLDWLPLIDELITTLSWWDTVDWLAPHLAGKLLLRHPDQMKPFTETWVSSTNRWQQRSALIFQLHYRHATRPDLLFPYVLRTRHSTEFFVQKGAGWALRQYSKIAPESVADFLRQYELPALTAREGGKWLRAHGGWLE
ncbi:MAG: DNA alkylation repair protein, partial [Lewinella sp.]|nr:DNA alkylation repair protein [Lewinella sp.]